MDLDSTVEIKEREAPKLTKREKVKVALLIVELYKTGKYTVESVCEAYGVSPRTFRNWVRRPLPTDKEKGIFNKNHLPTVAEAYEKAKEVYEIQFDSHLLRVCNEGLIKRIEGFETIETHVEEIPIKATGTVYALDEDGEIVDHNDNEDGVTVYRTKTKTVTKFVAPDVKLIMWVKEHLERPKWGEHVDVTIDDKRDHRDLDKLPINEVIAIANKLAKELDIELPAPLKRVS